MKLPKFSFPVINPKIIIILFSFILSFFLVYLSLTFLPKISLPKLLIPKFSFLTRSPKPTLIPTVNPTQIPTITPIPVITITASESAKLKVLVQNGTDIQGLAGSVSAKLKNAGFINVDIANAQRQDYLTWEITLKNKNTGLSDNFKSILGLTELTLKEATVPAGIDILIIAGKNK